MSKHIEILIEDGIATAHSDEVLTEQDVELIIALFLSPSIDSKPIPYDS